MSFDAHMNQSCTLLRQTANEEDSYGQPVRGWTQVTNGLRCRVEAMSGKDISRSSSKAVPLIDGQMVTHTGFFPMTIPLFRKDKVVVGTTAYIVQFADKDVGAAGHHQECLLSEVE